jgi:hypothetical protein
MKFSLTRKQAVVFAVAAAVSIAAAYVLSGAFSRKREGFVSKNSRVLVVMYSTPNILVYADLAARINEMYCMRHGYAFEHVIGDQNDTSMRPVWKKVFLVRDKLHNYEAVFWIDSDAFFNDHSKPLPLDTPEEFVVSSDFPNGPSLVNTGTFLVKNTPFARDFMNKWCSMRDDLNATYNSKFPFEQGAAEDLLRSLGPDSRRAKVYDSEFINSIFGKVSRGVFENSFVVHLMACPTEYRVGVMKKWLELNKVDTPSSPPA